MTTYALDPESGSVLAVWAAGVGHRATSICRLPAVLMEPIGLQLCEGLTGLSLALWETYHRIDADDGPDIRDLLDKERGVGFSGVLAAIGAPHLPDAHGGLTESYDPLLEYAHTVGRALHEIADAGVTAAVTTEVRAEIDAVGRAGLGDLSGRAAQAVSLERLDVSPVQVTAADQLLHEHPLGSDALFTTVDTAAACVAAAHWLVAAAEVAADATGVAPAGVFPFADDIESVSVEVPAYVVSVTLDDSATPREAVSSLLAEAHAVREGRIPDPAGLLQRVDAAREQIRRIDVAHREQTLAALLDRVTPLGSPASGPRPARAFPQRAACLPARLPGGGRRQRWCRERGRRCPQRKRGWSRR
ncbi:hypothetical protein ACN27G_29720 [Plantactinospora sp. WMMB334]|uniref:hypothetical protein n=1 Tax=Plantactinospora sp. WMMB334 TaxID=3404119 RepID=UPI003B95B774